MHARGDHNDGQWHLPQAGLREGMNRRVTSKDVLEVSGVKVLMEVGCCLAVCYALPGSESVFSLSPMCVCASLSQMDSSEEAYG